MSEHHALYQAILNDPDNDTLRLVYQPVEKGDVLAS
jgi:hypothetical protein